MSLISSVISSWVVFFPWGTLWPASWTCVSVIRTRAPSPSGIFPCWWVAGSNYDFESKIQNFSQMVIAPWKSLGNTSDKSNKVTSHQLTFDSLSALSSRSHVHFWPSIHSPHGSPTVTFLQESRTTQSKFDTLANNEGNLCDHWTGQSRNDSPRLSHQTLRCEVKTVRQSLRCKRIHWTLLCIEYLKPLNSPSHREREGWLAVFPAVFAGYGTGKFIAAVEPVRLVTITGTARNGNGNSYFVKATWKIPLWREVSWCKCDNARYKYWIL